MELKPKISVLASEKTCLGEMEKEDGVPENINFFEEPVPLFTDEHFTYFFIGRRSLLK